MGQERGTPRWGAAEGKAAGRDPAGRMMILASAMRYSVGRPAMGMGGGERTYGAAPPAAVWTALCRFGDLTVLYETAPGYLGRSLPYRNKRVPTWDRMEDISWQAA